MPWMIVQTDDEWCIYKKDTENKPIGDSLGCHPTQGEAQAQIAALYANEGSLNRRHHNRQPIKVLDGVEGVIRGYVFIWGDALHRDSYDTWFDKSRPPELDLDLLPLALRYEHGMDGAVSGERVGEIREVGFDDQGGYFLAYLDRSSAAFGRIIREIEHGTKDGPLRTSSGTASYLADFYDDGAFRFWPLAEVSLTAVPSESRMPDVELIRSERVQEASESVAIADLPAAPEQGSTPGELPEDQPPKGSIIMLQQIMDVLAGLPAEASLADVMAALLEAGFTAEELQEAVALLGVPAEGEAEAMSEERNEVDIKTQFSQALAQVLDAKAIANASKEAQANRARVRQLEAENGLLQARMAAPPAQVAPKGDTTGGGQITGMVDRKFDHLSAQAMALGHLLLKSKGRDVSEGYIRALAHKTVDYLGQGPAAYKELSLYSSARSAVPYRADEIMATATSLKGEDWLGAFVESNIWQVARSARIMAAVEAAGLWIVEVPDGSATATVPLEGADPTWYSAAENVSVTATGVAAPLVDPSVAATASVTVTPGKAMARVIVATELIEDAIVPTLSQINRQFEESAANAIEYLFLNADSATTASTNINLIDGTPATGTNAPLYLTTDGALKYALVTGTSTSRDGGVLSSGDFVETRKLLPDANSADPGKLIYVSDVSTYLKALELADVKTEDVFAGATLREGVLAAVWGSPYLASAQMGKAYTAGKLSGTAASNTKGRLACIYVPYMAMVWKRQVTFKTEEDIDADVTKMVASMRVAFQARGAGACTVSYNLTV